MKHHTLFTKMISQKKIQAVAYIMLTVSFMVITITVLGILLGGKQFAYRLSQMNRLDARAIVLELYSERYRMIVENMGIALTDKELLEETDFYLDKATSINDVEIFVLKVDRHKMFRKVGLVVTVSTIILLIWTELWRASTEDKQNMLEYIENENLG